MTIRLCPDFGLGEVAEWFKAPLSKSGIRLRVSRVRIPPSPPLKTDRISGDQIPGLGPHPSAHVSVDTKIPTVAYCLSLVQGGWFLSALGEVLEWTNRRAWRARRLGDRPRGFESRPLRHSSLPPKRAFSSSSLHPEVPTLLYDHPAKYSHSATTNSGFQVYPLYAPL